MKKLSAILVAAVMIAALIAGVIPASAADEIYSAAQDGDILYTVNFNGDDHFKPTNTKGTMKIEVDPADNNKATFTNEVDAVQAWWGGTVDNLPLNEDTCYTVYWTVARVEKAAIGYYPDANYGVYGYADKIKFMNVASSLTGHEYATFESKAITVLPELQHYAMEVNGYNATLALYVKDEVKQDYVLFDETEQEVEIWGFMDEYLGIYFYIYYANQTSTISECYVTKGLTWGELKEKETEPETTKKEITTAPVTTAEVTTAAAEEPNADDTTAATPVETTSTPSEKKGCKSFALLSVLAVIPAAVITFRRKH